MVETKDFRTCTSIRTYSPVRSELLSANIKITLHKALIRSVMTYACPAWELAADMYLFEQQRLLNKVFRTMELFCKVHIGPRFAHSFRLYNKIV
jgi:hypothetical protein